MQAAEPGSRGWRDTDIAATGRSEGGPAVLRDWRGMGTRAVVLHRTARLWTASTIAPLDCRPKKPESSQQIPQPCPQKLRPVALAEVFMKLAETCVVEQHIDWLLEAVEPTNFGSWNTGCCRADCVNCQGLGGGHCCSSQGRNEWSKPACPQLAAVCAAQWEPCDTVFWLGMCVPTFFLSY